MSDYIPYTPGSLSDEDEDWHLFEFGRNDFETASDAVISATSSITGIPAEEMTPPLYNIVDPDALNAIFFREMDDERTAGVVAFEMEECLISVYAGGTIAVRPPDYTIADD